MGEDTTLSQIIRMVADAAATKAPIAKVADKVSGVFVPTVIAIAVMTTAVWLLLRPDASALRWPAASPCWSSAARVRWGWPRPWPSWSATAWARRNGILFKTAVSLEETGKIKIVALDKTGTITQGEPQRDRRAARAEVHDGGSASGRRRWRWKQRSEHPLARRRACMRAEEEGRTAAPSRRTSAALPGNGLTATLSGETLLGGSLRVRAPSRSMCP